VLVNDVVDHYLCLLEGFGAISGIAYKKIVIEGKDENLLSVPFAYGLRNHVTAVFARVEDVKV